MSDIRITPGSSIMSFTSSLNYVETLKQDDSGSLNLYGSGSLGRTEIFSIDGNNGRLFTVTDDLSDSLFSVNTIAGLPVIEAFADNTVVMGQYGTNALVVSGSNVGIGTSSPSKLLTVRHGDAEGLRIEYNGNNNNLFFDASNIQAYNLTNPSDLKINPFGGKVFIGNPTLITSETFQVNGSGYFNSNVNVDGGLTINGSLNSGGSNFAGYRQGGDNIILKGNSTGVSGIFFQSEKDGTNINHTLDYGYIQFHPHGIDGTTGESNKLVIGVANDADDMVILQSPYKNGVKISYLNSSSGTGGTLHTVWNAGNHGSGSGLDADLLDGKHATDFIPTTHAINSISNGTGFLKNNGSGVWSYDNSTYDNYQSWILKTNGVQRTTIQTGGILDLVAGSNVSLSYGAGGVVTINSTDTNTTYSAGTGLTLTGTVFTPTFGTTAGTVAQGNDSRIINGQIAHGWGDHAGLYIPVGQKGVANGVATLDSSGLIPTTQLPSYVDDVIEAADLTALNALPAGGKQTGKIYVALDTNKSYRWSGSTFIHITSGAVDSVAGKTGVVTLVKGDVGLGNVDNTSDSTKSVASAAKLTTARTIGGVSFDGTANINLPGVNTAGNQNTTGNATTATTLQTARTLTIGATGKTFDGSANVAWSLAEIGAMSTSHVANAISSTDINTWNDAVTKSGTQTITGAKTFNSIINFSNNVGGIQGTIGDNDFWRIIGNNTASNAGYLEIATADEGNEPIYVRQYTGVFSSLTRTAVLLDGSGNTSFPGTITAGSFIKQGGTNAEFLMASGGTKNSDDFYQVNKGVVSTQNSLSVNGLQTLSIASTSTNFDGDLANITFEGTFANFNGSSNSSKSLGFTLAAPTSINQGIYYKTWYSASTPWRRLWDTSNFSQSNINNWNTAYGWGNHTSAGYALANGTNATNNWSNTSSGLSLNPSLVGKTLNASGQNVYLRDATYGQISGIVQDATDSPLASQWSNRLKTLHNNSQGYFTELAQSFTGTEGVWHRRNSGGTISSWKQLYDDSIWNAASLSYSGSTLTLTINGIQKTTTINAGTNYSLPTASNSTLGGVKLFSDTVQSVASNAVTTTASRTYGVQLNSSGQMVVNVPWVDTNTNTTYTAGDGLTLSGTVFSLPITVSGSGNYITDVTQTTTGITVTKGTLSTYSLPTASDSTLGGVKIGSGISIDGNGVISANTFTPGTANRLAKFSGSNLADSIIYDSGSNVGIGTTTLGARLDVRAQGSLATDIVFRVRNSADTQNILAVNGAGDVTDYTGESIYLKVITISGNTTITNSFHNKIVRITASCTITIPIGLRTDFNCTFEVIGAYTAQFVDASGVTTSAPFGRYLKTDLTAMFYCTGTASNYRLNGSLTTS